MTCNENRKLLNAYVDGELDSAGSLAVESHLRGCASCSREVENVRALVSGIENGALRFKAPPHLRRNVQAAIRKANPTVTSSFFQWRWVSVAASVVLIVALTWTVAVRRTQSSEEAQLVNDIVSNHVRSMMANHISDVASSDSHTVKPWFGGKLDYSPPAQELTAQGVRLVGSRL